MIPFNPQWRNISFSLSCVWTIEVPLSDRINTSSTKLRFCNGIFTKCDYFFERTNFKQLVVVDICSWFHFGAIVRIKLEYDALNLSLVIISVKDANLALANTFCTKESSQWSPKYWLQSIHLSSNFKFSFHIFLDRVEIALQDFIYLWKFLRKKSPKVLHWCCQRN